MPVCLTTTFAACEAPLPSAELHIGHVRTESPHCAYGRNSDRKANGIKGQRTRTHGKKTHLVWVAVPLLPLEVVHFKSIEDS